MRRFYCYVIACFVLSGFSYAQCDTVIVEHHTESKRYFYPDSYAYLRPTVLLLTTLENDQPVGKAYYTYKNGLLNGNYYVMNARGFCTDSGTYVNGVKEGIAKTYYSFNGAVMTVYHMKRGEPAGTTIHYNSSGGIARTQTIAGNGKDYEELFYYNNGMKAMKKTYREGILVDTVYKWFSNGDLKSILVVPKNGMHLYGRETFFKSFEDNFGIGVINCYMPSYPNGDEKSKRWKEKRDSTAKKYYLYEHPDDKTPAKGPDGSTISLYYSSDLGRGEISLAEANILIKKDQGKWLQLIVGVDDNQIKDVRTLWIRKSALKCDYLLWDKFLVAEGNRSCKILHLKENPLRQSPDEGSPLISCQYSKCWTITEVKGQWIKVVMDETNDCNVYNARKDKSCQVGGWVRWRDDHQILISSYLDPDP